MNEKLVNELRQYLKCGIRLSEKNLEFAEEFVELIGGILTDDFGEYEMLKQEGHTQLPQIFHFGSENISLLLFN